MGRFAGGFRLFTTTCPLLNLLSVCEDYLAIYVTVYVYIYIYIYTNANIFMHLQDHMVLTTSSNSNNQSFYVTQAAICQMSTVPVWYS